MSLDQSRALNWLRTLPSQLTSGVADRILTTQVSRTLRASVEQGFNTLFGGRTDTALGWLEKIDEALIQLNELSSSRAAKPSSFAAWAKYWSNLSPTRANLVLLANESLWERIPMMREVVSNAGTAVQSELQKSIFCVKFPKVKPNSTAPQSQTLFLTQIAPEFSRSTYWVDNIIVESSEKGVMTRVKRFLEPMRGKSTTLKSKLTLGQVLKEVRILPKGQTCPEFISSLSSVDKWILDSLLVSLKSDSWVRGVDSSISLEIAEVKFYGFTETFAQRIVKRFDAFCESSANEPVEVSLNLRRLGNSLWHKRLDPFTVLGLSLLIPTLLSAGLALFQARPPVHSALLWISVFLASLAMLSIVSLKLARNQISSEVENAIVRLIKEFPERACGSIALQLKLLDIHRIVSGLNAEINPRPLQRLLLRSYVKDEMSRRF